MHRIGYRKATKASVEGESEGIIFVFSIAFAKKEMGNARE